MLKIEITEVRRKGHGVPNTVLTLEADMWRDKELLAKLAKALATPFAVLTIHRASGNSSDVIHVSQNF